MIYRGRSGLLVARNNRGDTPLHCAAGAGNAGMISCIMALAAAGDETTVTEFLRMRNKCGETALHQAVRAGCKASMDKLMSVDPELAAFPSEADEGNTTSPLYLAISLGKEDIAEHLIQKTNGKLSCSGPDGRNVLHAAVTRSKGTCTDFIPHI
jgi:ankyrin repeat protein